MSALASSSAQIVGAAGVSHAKEEAKSAENKETPTQKHLVSHGRGGAANIGQDDTIYTDGGIIREGAEGDQGDGAYSAGRGGAANIGAVGSKQRTAHDQEVIPETAIKDTRHHEVFHTGRGGEGNLHHVDSEAVNDKHEHSHDENPTEKTTETGERASSISGESSNSKKHKGLLGKISGNTNPEDETDPVKKAKLEEKLAKKAEHEKKFPPPTHGGLGDKLKYKLFGRVYD